MTAIWWVRRDLRLADNQALRSALVEGGSVVPVFVLDPGLLASQYVGEKRLAFLLSGLRHLAGDLAERGSELIVRRGEPAEELVRLVGETGATAVYAERDVSPYACRRDRHVARVLPLVLTEGLTVHPVEAVRKSDGNPYVVYTPYSRSWKSLQPPDRNDLFAVPQRIPAPDSLRGALPSVPIPRSPTLPSSVPFVAGEDAAGRRIERFRHKLIQAYATSRDRMDLDGTSGLSPYLRFGMISARRAAVEALEALEESVGDGGRQGPRIWINELIWREFYIAILTHFPHVRRQSFRPAYRGIAWDNDPAAFRAWQEGRTGYPVVDAAMRQLVLSGWMHNRARMIVASFLTKDLLIDWRWGEQVFMQHLIDGDPAANNGGWQWTAGTGTDAAPYFRIFNPILQGKRYDPQGSYVRRWVPELRNVPDRYIHEPWKMSQSDQVAAGCEIGRDYPVRIIDHKYARERTLAAFKAARERYG